MPDVRPPQTQHPTATDAPKRVFDARLLIDLMVGPKQITPNNPIPNGRDGFQVREEGDFLLIGWKGQADWHWSKVHWSNVRFVRYACAHETCTLCAVKR